MDVRPVFLVIGCLLLALAGAMAVPLIIDLALGHDDWRVFMACLLLTGFIGGAMVLSHAGRAVSLSIRQTFVAMTACWPFLAFFAALPFMLGGLEMGLTDALFEAVSGLTTTGATVIGSLEAAPPGLLIWRAMLQWLGGYGAIMLATFILPLLKVGGMQLFRGQLSASESALPRTRRLAGNLALLYAAVTALCMTGYIAAGMAPFHAFAHAMTTLSTGGFSTFDTSFTRYDAPGVELVAILFMLAGALPFVLYLKALGGAPNLLWRDSQVRAFLGVCAAAIAAITLHLALSDTLPFTDALRRAAFNVTSIITGTGYISHDYMVWGAFPVSALLFIMVLGGCAGSTAGGIKIFRFQILAAVAVSQMKRLVHPHAVAPPRFYGKPLQPGLIISVLSFFFLYALCFAAMATALAYTGLDVITSLSGAASAISNVGPGLGEIIGGGGTYGGVPDPAKLILCLGMIAGRLELFALLVLLTPGFWRH